MGKKETNRKSDDQLVEMHVQARKQKKRKRIIAVCILIAAIVVAAAVIVLVARHRISETVGSSSSDVESAEVTTGSISTTVSGSGTLASTDVESIDVVSSVETVEFYVDEGDSVEEGDLIATVTNESLLSAMSDLQSELDTLDGEIEEAGEDEVSSTITAGASGRVKKIYASSGDTVSDVMYSDGALLLLSLDGYMAVDIESDSLSAGDSVTVTLSDDSTVSGEVDTSAGGTATILLTDNGTDYGDEVTVSDSDGNKVGSGTLYIHEQIKVTGYAGTVSSVSVSENESVSEGDTLFTLEDTDTSVAYDSLLNDREEIEDQLNTLVRIYEEGGICATVAGTVESLSETSGSDASSLLTSSTSTDASDSGTTTTAGTASETTVAEIAPDSQMTVTISVDETDILSLEEGQEAEVTIDSIGEDTYSGSVTDISTTATSDSGVTAYSAEITIDKTEDMLAGMSATAVVTIEGVEDALIIPVDALHQTSSTSYVYTEYDESTEEFSGMVEVTTGISNSSYVEITDGLSEGDVVYYTASEEESDFGSMMNGGDAGSMGGESSGTADGDMSMPSGGGDSSGGQMPGGDSSGQTQ